MIVLWCSQLEAMSHPSVECLLTHCGWNSTIEGAHLRGAIGSVEDEWMVGLRLIKKAAGIVDADNINDCLESILGGGKKSEAIRGDAREGGTSDKNLRNLIRKLITSPFSNKNE